MTFVAILHWPAGAPLFREVLFEAQDRLPFSVGRSPSGATRSLTTVTNKNQSIQDGGRSLRVTFNGTFHDAYGGGLFTTVPMNGSISFSAASPG